MIRVAFVIDCIDSPTAGTERQLLLLLKHLDRKRFHPILCVLRSSRWIEESFDLCPTFVVGIESFFDPGAWTAILRFSRFLRRESVDIVQTYFYDSDRAGILAARLAAIDKVISSRRNQGYWHTSGKLLVLKAMNRWVRLYVANCESTRKWAAAAEKIPIERIKVIYNGVELERFAAASGNSRNGVRRMLEVGDQSLLVGVTANLRPVKGLDLFIRAAALVRRAIPATRFVIVGDGPEEAHLKALAADLGVEGTVRFFGRCDDVGPLLRAMDVGVLPSRSESFSNAVIEYMASGLPVVCTNVGGARELVENGVNGYLVAPGDVADMADRLIAILNDGSAGEMGRRGKAIAEGRFPVGRMIREYEEMFSGMAGKRPSRIPVES